eukprot:1476149-Rhodomonas_salina.7
MLFGRPRLPCCTSCPYPTRVLQLLEELRVLRVPPRRAWADPACLATPSQGISLEHAAVRKPGTVTCHIYAVINCHRAQAEPFGPVFVKGLQAVTAH